MHNISRLETFKSVTSEVLGSNNIAFNDTESPKETENMKLCTEILRYREPGYYTRLLIK